MPKSLTRIVIHPDTDIGYSLIRRGTLHINDAVVSSGLWVSPSGKYLMSVGADDNLINIREDAAEEIVNSPLDATSFYEVFWGTNPNVVVGALPVWLHALADQINQEYGVDVVATTISNSTIVIVEHGFDLTGLPTGLFTVDVGVTAECWPEMEPVEITGALHSPICSYVAHPEDW